MNATTIKLAIGVVLFATWVVLVVCNVPNSADLIMKIQLALLGLGFYHINEAASARSASSRTVYAGEALLGTADPLLAGLPAVAHNAPPMPSVAPAATESAVPQ